MRFLGYLILLRIVDLIKYCQKLGSNFKLTGQNEKQSKFKMCFSQIGFREEKSRGEKVVTIFSRIVVVLLNKQFWQSKTLPQISVTLVFSSSSTLSLKLQIV